MPSSCGSRFLHMFTDRNDIRSDNVALRECHDYRTCRCSTSILYFEYYPNYSTIHLVYHTTQLLLLFAVRSYSIEKALFAAGKARGEALVRTDEKARRTKQGRKRDRGGPTDGTCNDIKERESERERENRTINGEEQW